MYREDYIMSLIRQTGAVWAQIVDAIRAHRFETGRALIEQSYGQVLGLPSDALRRLTPRELVARLRFDMSPELGRQRCLWLAALLTAAGDLAAAQGDDDARAEAHFHALVVLLDVLLHDGMDHLPAHTPTVAQLTERLAADALPAETLLQLCDYYERTGAYAQAENVLFEALEQAPDRAAVVAHGRGFYARLRQLDDEALAAGDLPRPEVEAGSAALEQRT